MSRKAARFTQAEAARFARVAAKLGPPWRVISHDGILELVQDEKAKPLMTAEQPLAPERKWRL